MYPITKQPEKETETMNILYKLNVANHKDLYDLTKSPAIKKMSSIEGETRGIDCAVIYEDMKHDGEIQKILSIRCKESGEIFATNSPTFIQDFEDARDMMKEFNEEIHTIRVEGGTSRNGRHFISCVYVD